METLSQALQRYGRSYAQVNALCQARFDKSCTDSELIQRIMESSHAVQQLMDSNTDLLNQFVFPLLTAPVSAEEEAALFTFSQKMTAPAHPQDVSLGLLIMRRMMELARQREDTEAVIRYL